MFDEYERKKKKQISLMRSLLDYGMGIIILLAGVVFCFRQKFGDISFNRRFPPNDIDKIFGAVCIIYGTWRIYRGYQKKYFR